MQKTGGLEQAVYQIVVQGELDDKWSTWFNDMIITLERAADDLPFTVLTVQAVDQAKLRGILNKLWDLNLTVISLKRLDESSSGG